VASRRRAGRRRSRGVPGGRAGGGAARAAFPPQTWMGLVAPAGTPRAIVGKLNATVNDVLRPAALRASLAKLGFKEAPGSPDDFGRLIATDAEKWAAVVAISGAKGE